MNQDSNDQNKDQSKDPQKDDSTENDSVTWSHDIDLLLAKWCDNAKCYEWMHTESASLYSRKNKAFLISTNIITAIAGITNIITDNISSFNVGTVFGGISILVSTINIIYDKLGYSGLVEIHKKCALHWSIIIARIEEVVILPYSSRTDCKAFMKYIKKDINQVSFEGKQLIPESIRDACLNKFKNIENFDIPDICGHVEHTRIYIQDDLNKPLI